MSAPRRRAPAGRYRGRPGWGDPRAERRSRLLRIGLSVVLGVGVAAAVSSYVASTQPDVRSEVTSFEVLSDNEVQVDYEVDKPAGVEALCVLRARDAEGIEVARAEVIVPASDPDMTVRRDVLTTTGVPVTGEVIGCAPTADLARPRPNS